MKKWIATVALLLVMAACLSGCGKTQVLVSIDGLEQYEISEFPMNAESFSHDENGITLTLKEDGDYAFKIKDNNDNEYTVTLKYYDNTATVDCDADIAVSAEII